MASNSKVEMSLEDIIKKDRKAGPKKGGLKKGGITKKTGANARKGKLGKKTIGGKKRLSGIKQKLGNTAATERLVQKLVKKALAQSRNQNQQQTQTRVVRQVIRNVIEFLVAWSNFRILRCKSHHATSIVVLKSYKRRLALKPSLFEESSNSVLSHDSKSSAKWSSKSLVNASSISQLVVSKTQFDRKLSTLKKETTLEVSSVKDSEDSNDSASVDSSAHLEASNVKDSEDRSDLVAENSNVTNDDRIPTRSMSQLASYSDNSMIWG
jgi:hypothetical protein